MGYSGHVHNCPRSHKCILAMSLGRTSEVVLPTATKPGDQVGQRSRVLWDSGQSLNKASLRVTAIPLCIARASCFASSSHLKIPHQDVHSSG